MAFCSHISKELHTYMVSSKPWLSKTLIRSCRAVTEAQVSGPPPQAPRCYFRSWWPPVLIPYSAAGGRRRVEQIPASSSVQKQRLCSDALKLGANPTSFLKNNHLFLGCLLPSPHPLCLQPTLGRTVDEGRKAAPPHFEVVALHHVTLG